MKLTNKQRIKLIASEIKLNPHNISKIKKMIKDASKDEINLNIRCYGGKTLFHYAVRYNTKGIISTLVKLGGNPNLCDDKFIAPLHYCVLKNCYHAAEELIKNKADINIPGEFEQTPLHLAVIKDNVELNKTLAVPQWLERDFANLSGKVLKLASREDIDVPVEEHLIVELYSK